MAQSSRDEHMQAALATYEDMQKLWRAYFMATFTQKERPGAHFAALYIIKAKGPLSSRQLGEVLYITPGAVTQLVDYLVKEGLVERQPSQEDRRVTNLSVTADGEAKIEKIHQERRSILAEIYGVLSDEELATLVTAQQKMTTQLQKMYQQKVGKETDETTSTL